MYESTTYKYKEQIRLSIPILIGTIALLSLILAMNVVSQLLTYGPSLPPLELFQLQFAVIAISLLTIGVLYITVPVVTAFATTAYLCIGPEGLDYNFLPVLRYQCQWSDIDEIAVVQNQVVLFLRESCEVTGNSFGMWLVTRFSPFNRHCFSLNSFEGWSDGRLAEDLSRYAPLLFRK